MTIGEQTTTATNLADADLSPAASELVAGLLEHPWGQVSPSVYETGRLVAHVPWLTGHAERVAFLLAAQRPDGTWGAPVDGYALVPTLSATDALLSVLRADGPRENLVGAAALALHALFTRLSAPSFPSRPLPDMPAIELIAPYLAERVDDHLAALAHRPIPGLQAYAGRRLALPAALDGRMLGRVRRLLESGATVPKKLLHAVEVAGDAAPKLPGIVPEVTGTIGASPAATAAWLGPEPPADPSSPARWHLEAATAQHGGPVPVGFPLTVFERAWVLAWLLRAGVRVEVPPLLVLSLTAPLGPFGTAAAEGLPADADTTAGVLYALALVGAPHRPDPLLAYELDDHFCTWQGEDGASPTTNAHVLEAFGQYVAATGDTDDRYRAVIAKVARWLRSRQSPDGSWTDRWHASPYYATACCAIALARFDPEGSADAVAAARRWVLGTQRPDGSWGCWEGTAEESAYAVQTLLLTPGGGAAAAERAGDLLRTAPDEGPAMWHDKDLYRPTAIIRAGVIAALQLLSEKRSDSVL
ncbi:Terpentedienyl-diphosphate synthase [Actinomadura rubteroloni]|uniref:Terpentedienyl-diphosphate synthase n=1 Tax=Actinomadura rubteroloni TaxID=1926885 RepID=A0A2P4UKC2_9ACTN|nr:prenyltransferase/squalene oxidase repeat-containing protein [Actinomadura rubteroloni]POM25503.1 Terpentedienyl-diphosphate synthase [Actinomadura rubteroloni]